MDRRIEEGRDGGKDGGREGREGRGEGVREEDVRWSVVVCDSLPNCWSAVSSPELNVTVTADYTSYHGENPGELDVNEFRAGVGHLTLLCQVEGGIETLSYQWTVERLPTPGCTSCSTPSSTTDTLFVDSVLLSYFAGTYTCTVGEAGRPSSSSSDSFTFSVVGEPHYLCVFCMYSSFHVYMCILY